MMWYSLWWRLSYLLAIFALPLSHAWDSFLSVSHIDHHWIWLLRHRWRRNRQEEKKSNNSIYFYSWAIEIYKKRRQRGKRWKWFVVCRCLSFASIHFPLTFIHFPFLSLFFLLSPFVSLVAAIDVVLRTSSTEMIAKYVIINGSYRHHCNMTRVKWRQVFLLHLLLFFLFFVDSTSPSSERNKNAVWCHHSSSAAKHFVLVSMSLVLFFYALRFVFVSLLFILTS